MTVVAKGLPRGRPPLKRAAILTYWRDHGPCSIGQLCRATNTERSRLKRILRDLVKKNEIVEFSPLPMIDIAA